MKKIMLFWVSLIIIPFSLHASQYLRIETEEDLPIVSNNIRHFLDTESETIDKIKDEKTFSKENCKKIILGKSYLMADFRNNSDDFKNQLRSSFNYITSNKEVIEEKIKNTEIDSNFLYGLWFLHNLTSQFK